MKQCSLERERERERWRQRQRQRREREGGRERWRELVGSEGGKGEARPLNPETSRSHTAGRTKQREEVSFGICLPTSHVAVAPGL